MHNIPLKWCYKLIGCKIRWHFFSAQKVFQVKEAVIVSAGNSIRVISASLCIGVGMIFLIGGGGGILRADTAMYAHTSKH